MENTKKLIDEVYKNVRMASYAIDCLIEKIENRELEELLRKQNKFYLDMVERIQVLSNGIDYEPKDISMMLKGMSFTSIKMKTMMNNDTPKFAEMLVQGTTMGITDTLKAKGEYKTDNSELKQIVDEVIHSEEEFVDSLKTFLE
ncbi:MAG: hypothetical protein IJD48_04040 [Clostridia bacterium]|nr:hypothetical protein [Clostridia bacterium]